PFPDPPSAGPVAGNGISAGKNCEGDPDTGPAYPVLETRTATPRCDLSGFDHYETSGTHITKMALSQCRFLARYARIGVATKGFTRGMRRWLIVQFRRPNEIPDQLHAFQDAHLK